MNKTIDKDLINYEKFNFYNDIIGNKTLGCSFEIQKTPNTIDRKFEEVYDVSDYEIFTDEGWKNVSKVMKTEKYEVWYIKLENGMFLKCADDHIVFDESNWEVFVKDLKIDDSIQTEKGLSKVVEINNLNYKENMYDMEVENHRYYSNGILSHNTECVGAYAIWYACFNSHKRIGIGSNKEKSAKSFLGRIKFMYERIPSHLKPGVVNWAEKSVRFDNGTVIEISATSKDAFRGEPLSLLILDELAFVDPPWKAEEFWKSNYPTISAAKTSKIIIISTPNGLHNLFHRMYTGAKNKTNSFVCSTYDWTCVPTRDKEWAKEQLDNLGQVSWNQEFGIQFIGSSQTIIDPQVLRFLLEKEEVYPSLIDLNGKFRIYEKPEKNCHYLTGCLPPYEKVLTNNGIKSVINIKPDDKLYDQKGNLTNIKNIQIYKNIDEEIYTIKPYATYRTTTFTGGHPLLISQNPKMKRIHGGDRYRDFDFKFVKSMNVKKGDWIKYPNIYKDKKIDFDINNKWYCYDDVTRCDFKIESPLQDLDFWWFIGMWLGDGWVQNLNSSYTIHTCHDKKSEQHFAERIKNIFKKYNRCVFIDNKKKSVVNTCFSSKQLYNFLVDNFNKGALNKTIPEWVKMIPKKYKLQLIRGYIDSDGCLVNGKNFNIISISLNLLEGIQDILYSVGVLSSVGKLRDKQQKTIIDKLCDCKKTYGINLSTYDSYHLSKLINYEYDHIIHRKRNKRYQYFSKNKNYIYIRIQDVSVNKYKGNVYNFETEDHTYLSRNITTHNSDVAKGTGGDYSVIQILKIISLNPLQLKQVAVFEDNTIDPYHFAEIVNRVSYYYNNAYIMVENNNEGSTVVSQLHWEFENENLINTGGKIRDLGIRATTGTKPKAVILMKKLIEDNSLELIDKKTIDQLSDFTDNGNKKYSCLNMNDDLVSALYWCCHFFSLDMLEEGFELKNIDDLKKENDEDDAWGILSDVDLHQEDWSWL